jgi:hypothetical protein
MCPILAEKTVERTAMIEDCEVFKPVFWASTIGIVRISSAGSSWTDPIGYTIGWEPIIIPTDVSLPCRDAFESTIFSSPQTAIAPTILWNLTPVEADLARGAGEISWRPSYQLKWYSRLMVSLFNEGSDGLLSRSKTI